MRKILALILLITFAFSCGETKEKMNSENASQEVPKEIRTDNKLLSADYSSLFTDFTCNISAAEVAKVLNLPVSDVSVPDYKSAKGCSFIINGFGKNGLGDETRIGWFLEEVTKAQVKQEIQSYLDYQKDNIGLGMGIEKSETGDTYLAKSPSYGRVIVLNENYANWLFINYAPKHQYKSRTEEQHLALGAKMIDLANYLLQKHKK